MYVHKIVLCVAEGESSVFERVKTFLCAKCQLIDTSEKKCPQCISEFMHWDFNDLL